MCHKFAPFVPFVSFVSFASMGRCVQISRPVAKRAAVVEARSAARGAEVIDPDDPSPDITRCYAVSIGKAALFFSIRSKIHFRKEFFPSGWVPSGPFGISQRTFVENPQRAATETRARSSHGTFLHTLRTLVQNVRHRLLSKSVALLKHSLSILSPNRMTENIRKRLTLVKSEHTLWLFAGDTFKRSCVPQIAKTGNFKEHFE